MKYLILITSVLLLAFKNPTHTDCSNIIYKFNVDTSKYAFFKLEENPSMFGKRDRSTNLSTREIDQIENIMDKEIAKTNKEYKKSQHTKFNYVGNPRKYYKQVISVINEKGEKVVWVNCLCTVSNEPDWKTRLIGVLDGGSCYFNCKINLTTNKFYDLIINGVA